MLGGGLMDTPVRKDRHIDACLRGDVEVVGLGGFEQIAEDKLWIGVFRLHLFG